jgi:hypothetical protein
MRASLTLSGLNQKKMMMTRQRMSSFIADCRLPIANLKEIDRHGIEIGNRQSAIGNVLNEVRTVWL